MTNHEIKSDKIMNQQRTEEQHQRQHYDYYNNNNSRVRAREAGRLPGTEIMQLIADAYRANVAKEITRAAARIIEDALTHGMEPDTVILAIEETGLASRPSPYYMRAVLRNWAEHGVVVSRTTDEIRTTAARPWWQR